MNSPFTQMQNCQKLSRSKNHRHSEEYERHGDSRDNNDDDNDMETKRARYLFYDEGINLAFHVLSDK